MKKCFHLLLSIIAVAALAACSSVQKIPLNAKTKNTLKSIAIVEASEPTEYFLNPGALPGGQALYMFGALGGLIYGSIDAARAQSATTEFTSALASHKPVVAAQWNDEVERQLSAKPYTFTRIPPLPKTKDGKKLDCNGIKGQYDAVLITEIRAGYTMEFTTSPAEPLVEASAQLLSSDCSKTFYSEPLAYGAQEWFGKYTFVKRAPEHTFVSREALFGDIPKVRDALRAGTSELAKRVASEL